MASSEMLFSNGGCSEFYLFVALFEGWSNLMEVKSSKGSTVGFWESEDSLENNNMLTKNQNKLWIWCLKCLC